MRLLVADDDAVSLRKLEYIFTNEGYEVLLASDGPSALFSMQNEKAPRLAILDIMMPGMSGIEICQRIRSIHYSIPPYIIILTVRGSRQDIIRGLEAGADDYLTKPFDVEELKSRVRVGVRMVELHLKLFNRVKDLEETLSRVQQLQGLLRRGSHIYEFGPFRLEATQRRLLHNREPLPITSKGLDILLLLVQNSGYLIEKEEIMHEIWPNMIVEENNLTVHISTLRKLLGDDHGQHNYIKTVPTRGYRFIATVIEVNE